MGVLISEKERLIHICLIASKVTMQWNLSYLLINLLHDTNENKQFFSGRLVLSTTRLSSEW